MRIDWTTFALQAINLVILLGVLGRFLFRPVADMIERRRAEAARLLADAEAEKARARAARENVEAEAKSLEARRAAALADIAREVEQQRQAWLEAARAQTANMFEAAKADAQRAREQGLAEVTREASALALQIAEKLLARLPDEARVSGFVEGLADAVGALPDTARAEIGDGARLTLRSARPLDERERSALGAALATRLGRAVAFDCVVDESLVAGLELDAPHARVANSWRADLRVLAEEFAR